LSVTFELEVRLNFIKFVKQYLNEWSLKTWLFILFWLAASMILLRFFAKLCCGEKVRCTKITSSKTKKNSKNFLKNSESWNQSELRKSTYGVLPRYGCQGLWGVRLGSVRLV
jgi:hypothetical protein